MIHLWDAPEEVKEFLLPPNSTNAASADAAYSTAYTAAYSNVSAANLFKVAYLIFPKI